MKLLRHRVNLTWTDVASGEDGYTLERGRAGSGAWQVIATLPADSTSYPDTGLDCETTYAWRVSAFNCAGTSGYALGQQTTGTCCVVESFCTSSPNSVGAGAVIGTVGSTAISAADFTLTATGAVPGQAAIFLYGPDSRAGTPYGNGVLCVAPGSLGLFRLLPAQPVTPGGTAAHLVDFTGAPAGAGPGKIEPGSTWHFQLAYRDPAGGGQGFNVSDALRVTFCP